VLLRHFAILLSMVSPAFLQPFTVFYKNFTALLRRVYDCARRFCYPSHHLPEWWPLA
jgi:hypothetical protein